MLDYEEYGANFRMPRSMRPGGGPQNNGLGVNAQRPDGRPPKRTPINPDGQPDPNAPAAPAPQPPAAMPRPQLTFTQMQTQGLPRPPAPSPNSAVAMPGAYNNGGMGGAGLQPFPGSQPGWEGVGPYTGGTLPTDSGGGDLQGQIYQDYQNERNRAPVTGPASRYTSPDSGPLGSATEQAVMSALGNPSRYDAGVVKDSFGYLGGAIDDQYNQLDNQLRASLAERGMGAAGDSTIGTSNQINQNLARRTAKQNLASELLREQANTYGSDRAQAIAAAMGYGGQKFGQNLQANESNFGQDLSRGNFGLNAENQRYNQRRGALQDYTNFGQQQYQNQYNTNLFNQQQQRDQQDFLMRLLGYQ